MGEHVYFSDVTFAYQSQVTGFNRHQMNKLTDECISLPESFPNHGDYLILFDSAVTFNCLRLFKGIFQNFLPINPHTCTPFSYYMFYFFFVLEVTYYYCVCIFVEDASVTLRS